MARPKGSIRLEMLGSLFLVGIIFAIIAWALVATRNRTFNEHTKEMLSSIRAYAEILHSQSGVYETSFDSIDNCEGGSFFTDESIKRYLADLRFSTQVDCRVDQLHYLIQAELSDGRWYCIDDSGFSKVQNQKVGSGYNCYIEPVKK